MGDGHGWLAAGGDDTSEPGDGSTVADEAAAEDGAPVADGAAAARDAVAAAARRALTDAESGSGADDTPAWVAAALSSSDGDDPAVDDPEVDDPEVDDPNVDDPDVADRRPTDVRPADAGPEALADRVAARLVARTLLAAVGDGDDGASGRGDATPALVPPAAVDLPAPAAGALADLTAAVDAAPDEREAVARAYGAVVPADRRRERGEYYTPRPVRDLVARLTVTAPDDRVLDPACGTGGFLASAARRKRALSSEHDDAIDTEITSALVGVEVAPEPARLAEACLPADVHVADFFAVPPAALGGPFDAVVGNPPYVRHEAIADVEAVREHLDRVGWGDLSRRSDLYAYFLTRATELLAPGGDLGLVVSDRWLDTRYGEDLQGFLLDNYAVRAVVTFDRGVFEDALVDASLVVARRREDPAARDGTTAHFVRVRPDVVSDAGNGGEPNRVADIVARDRPPDRLVDAPGYRLATRRQADLRGEAKWNAYHLAPPLYFELRDHPGTVPLGALADVRYGVKTGANDFFVGRADEFAARDLEAYAAPFLKATGQVDAIAVSPAEADGWRVLDAHDAVREALSVDGRDAAAADASPTADVDDPVAALEAAGHEPLARHVERGERAGYHERPSVAAREPWFDLGPLPRPRLLATTFTWRVHRVHWNVAGAVPSDQFYAVEPDGVDSAVLGGVLNSRAVRLAAEVLGRRAGGEGMTRLQTKVYEAERWPVPDPRSMTAERRAAVGRAFRRLRERERAAADSTSVEKANSASAEKAGSADTEEPSAATTEGARDALDRAVLGGLDLDRGVEETLADLRAGVERLVARRAGYASAPDDRTRADLPPADGGG